MKPDEEKALQEQILQGGIALNGVHVDRGETLHVKIGRQVLQFRAFAAPVLENGLLTIKLSLPPSGPVGPTPKG